MIQAIILDMDGLLIDSEPFWEEAHVTTFTEIGVPITPELTNETVGLRLDEGVEHWYRKYPWTGISKKEVEARILDRVKALIREKGVSRPGVKELVALIKSKNLPMAIASSSAMEVIDTVLDVIGIREYLTAVHSAEHEDYGKPHPGVFLSAAKALHVPPDACLVFEDTPNGVIAAKAARMKCVAVPYEEMKDDIRFSIADVKVDALTDFNEQLLDRFLV